MPNRMMRDWTESARFDGLSAEAERQFTRLIMKADDYGRYSADWRRVKSGCFPLDDYSKDQIESWLNELKSREIIGIYVVDGREYLAIPKYGQRLKNSKAKFPQMEGKNADWLASYEDFREVPGSSGKLPPEEKRREEKRRDIEGEAGGEVAGGKIDIPSGSIPISELIEDFNEWSLFVGGKSVDAINGASRPIQDLISATSQQPHVVRSGTPVRPDLLIPVAVDFCKNRRKEFKSLKYACAIIKSELEEWAVKGMPGERAKNSKPISPPETLNGIVKSKI